jgi:hypothetical protein
MKVETSSSPPIQRIILLYHPFAWRHNFLFQNHFLKIFTLSSINYQCVWFAGWTASGVIWSLYYYYVWIVERYRPSLRCYNNILTRGISSLRKKVQDRSIRSQATMDEPNHQIKHVVHVSSAEYLRRKTINININLVAFCIGKALISQL